MLRPVVPAVFFGAVWGVLVLGSAGAVSGATGTSGAGAGPGAGDTVRFEPPEELPKHIRLGHSVPSRRMDRTRQDQFGVSLGHAWPRSTHCAPRQPSHSRREPREDQQEAAGPEPGDWPPWVCYHPCTWETSVLVVLGLPQPFEVFDDNLGAELTVILTKVVVSLQARAEDLLKVVDKGLIHLGRCDWAGSPNRGVYSPAPRGGEGTVQTG